jgi:hypothetical protein
MGWTKYLLMTAEESWKVVLMMFYESVKNEIIDVNDEYVIKFFDLLNDRVYGDRFNDINDFMNDEDVVDHMNDIDLNLPDLTFIQREIMNADATEQDQIKREYIRMGIDWDDVCKDYENSGEPMFKPKLSKFLNSDFVQRYTS